MEKLIKAKNNVDMTRLIRSKQRLIIQSLVTIYINGIMPRTKRAEKETILQHTDSYFRLEEQLRGYR